MDSKYSNTDKMMDDEKYSQYFPEFLFESDEFLEDEWGFDLRKFLQFRTPNLELGLQMDFIIQKMVEMREGFACDVLQLYTMCNNMVKSIIKNPRYTLDFVYNNGVECLENVIGYDNFYNEMVVIQNKFLFSLNYWINEQSNEGRYINDCMEQLENSNEGDVGWFNLINYSIDKKLMDQEEMEFMIARGIRNNQVVFYEKIVKMMDDFNLLFKLTECGICCEYKIDPDLDCKECKQQYCKKCYVKLGQCGYCRYIWDKKTAKSRRAEYLEEGGLNLLESESNSDSEEEY